MTDDKDSAVTQADRYAMESILWVNTIIDDQEAIAQAFAHHRQYGYDQGYYDGRQADGAEERAAIVAWLMREEDDYPSGKYSGFAAIIREEIEAGEHLK